MSRFTAWRDIQPNSDGGAEIKGTGLSAAQQASFAANVILESPGLCLTLAGTNTSLFQRKIAQRLIGDSVSILRATAGRAEQLGKPSLAEEYRKMARWAGERSPENAMWLICLTDAIRLSIQHSVVLFAEDGDACEFGNIEIFIDQHFIRKGSHVGFWKEWLRNSLLNSSLKEPIPIIKQWPSDHPFRRKYARPNQTVDMSEIFRSNMRFVDSKGHPGIQIADICANIAYRFYSGNRKYRPYRFLRQRVIGRDAHQIHYTIIDSSSLLADAPENHVQFYTEEDLAAWAARQPARS